MDMIYETFDGHIGGLFGYNYAAMSYITRNSTSARFVVDNANKGFYYPISIPRDSLLLSCYLSELIDLPKHYQQLNSFQTKLVIRWHSLVPLTSDGMPEDYKAPPIHIRVGMLLIGMLNRRRHPCTNGQQHNTSLGNAVSVVSLFSPMCLVKLVQKEIYIDLHK
jgi:hypothetical protein